MDGFSGTSKGIAKKWGQSIVVNIPKTPTEKEQEKAASAWTDYRDQTKAAQTAPTTVTDYFKNYKGAQTKTSADYTRAMKPNIDANIGRMQDQYNQITANQASIADAMAKAQRGYDAERASRQNFFESETKPKYDAAMAKAAAEYDRTKNEVRQKMEASDAYYKNDIKPQYAKLMEGGLSLRDASDPSNFVSQGVQNAYEKLVQKSQADADRLATQTRKGGQADYGVLAALGNQARGSVAAPMTGAQTQLAQQASMNQASQAYQMALNRVAAIEDQQRLYAQNARQLGLQSGMDQSWKNYENYRTSTGAAQQADLANYNAQLAGTTQLGNLTAQDASTQFAGAGGLSSARSQLSSDIQSAIGGGFAAANQSASSIGNLANTGMGISDYMFQQQSMLPQFNYQTRSGFNQGDYSTAMQAEALRAKNAQDIANIELSKAQDILQMQRGDRMREEDIASYKEAQTKAAQAQQAAAKAQQRGSMMSSIFGTIGTIGGGIVGGLLGGGPVGAIAGASVGGSLLGGIGNIAAGGAGSRFQSLNLSSLAALQENRNATAQATIPQYQSPTSLSNYWQQKSPLSLTSQDSAIAANNSVAMPQTNIAATSYVPTINPQYNQAGSVGISPTMQSAALNNRSADLAKQYGLKIDPTLYYSPYSNYSLMSTYNS